MKKVSKAFSVGLAPVLAWLFPVFFMYTRNVKEVAVKEVMQPAAIFLVCGAAALLIGAALFRDWKSGAFFSVISGLLLANFALILDLVQKGIPHLRYWHLIYLVVVLSIAVCWAVKRFKLVDDALFVAKIVFGGLIAFNLITAMPTMVQRISDSQARAEETAIEGNYQTGKQNIYYLLCDEYASFAQMQEDFGFDNAAFRNEVQELKFNISETSRNAYYNTNVVVANLMQLDYVADYSSTSVELDNLTKNGVLQRLLTENGYTLRGVGDTQWLGIEGTIASSGGATTVDGKKMSDIILANSFLKPFIKKNYVAAAQQIVDTLNDLDNMEIEPDSSVFTFAYINCPHQPYYLDENGKMNPPEKWSNEADGSNDDAYIGAVKYVNSRIIPAVKRIIEQDPNAVVVLCSDHGNRFGKASKKNFCRNLNLLYFAGEEVPEFEGLSSVNTMRMVLNRTCGLNMEYLDVPLIEEG